MSYNILADDLLKANPELYTHCPWEVLDWHYRCRRILMEIQKWAPDVSLMHIQKTKYISALLITFFVDSVSSRSSRDPLL